MLGTNHKKKSSSVDQIREYRVLISSRSQYLNYTTQEESPQLLRSNSISMSRCSSIRSRGMGRSNNTQGKHPVILSKWVTKTLHPNKCHPTLTIWWTNNNSIIHHSRCRIGSNHPLGLINTILPMECMDSDRVEAVVGQLMISCSQGCLSLIRKRARCSHSSRRYNRRIMWASTKGIRWRTHIIRAVWVLLVDRVGIIAWILDMLSSSHHSNSSNNPRSSHSKTNLSSKTLTKLR